MGRPKNVGPGPIKFLNGKARCWLGGKWVHLGNEADPPGYRARYVELTAKWAIDPSGPVADKGDLLVSVLFRDYLASADSPRGADHRHRIKTVLSLLHQLYPKTPAAEFKPADFKAWQGWVCKLPSEKKPGQTRFNATSVRDMRAVVKSVWKWGVANRGIPADVWQALRAVPPPKHTEVRQAKKVQPADPKAVEKVMPTLPPVVRAVVTLIRLSGARPTEIMSLKPEEVDTSGDVWEFRPALHKGLWRGKTRVLYLGAEAQEVLRPWLGGDPAAFVFKPTGARAKAPRYNHRSLGLAVRRACKRAGVAFTSYSLRHLLGAELRKSHGLEAVRAVLGHSFKSMSDMYSASADADIAREVARGRAVG